MSSYDDINDQMSNLDIEEEENDVFVLEGEVDEEINKYKFCVV